MKKIFNTILTFAVLTVSTFGIISTNTSAVELPPSRETGNIYLKVERWVGGPDSNQPAFQGQFEVFNCFTGPDVVHGVDVTFIKRECRQALDTWHIKDMHAYINHFDAYYGRNQVIYGFEDGSGWSNFQTFDPNLSGNPARMQWFSHEPDFNKVYVAAGTLTCANGNCDQYTELTARSWGAQDCSQETVASFTPQEFRAACNRSINEGLLFAHKLKTVNRQVTQAEFVGTWTGTAWIDPITGLTAQFREIQ